MRHSGKQPPCKERKLRAAVPVSRQAAGKGLEKAPAPGPRTHPPSLRNLMVRREEVKKALSRLIEEQTADHRLISDEDLRDAFNHAEREISAQTHYLLLERKSEELQKIESLIKRLAEKNDYGRCEECGKHIPEARLLIVPDATLCVPCQRQLEKQHSGKGLPRSSYIFAGKHDALDWEREEGDGRCRETPLTIETDMDHLSFPDMDEVDIEDGTPESGEES